MRLGCLHAHHSNIALISDGLCIDGLALTHFVDPGVLIRSELSGHFPDEASRAKIREQLQWIAACGVDAILITCTQYIAGMQPEDENCVELPIIKLDEPFFHDVSSSSGSHRLLFSNPATIKGTMARYHSFSHVRSSETDVRAELVPDSFPLLMSGRTAEYREAIYHGLQVLAKRGEPESISVAQLSMVPAAELFEASTGRPIGNPLKSLRAEIERILFPS
ncbi:hypothetical protein [Brevibacillus borstelensis]|uniref:hypothetical protein n=1 Tax=Brevibacillus borstelensis TaxID=45462 RepID=UPI0030F853FC